MFNGCFTPIPVHNVSRQVLTIKALSLFAVFEDVESPERVPSVKSKYY
jgi:hypothetical protein